MSGELSGPEVDQERVCRDCSRPFTWSVEEQQQYARAAAWRADGRSWAPPSRCPFCRRLYRQWLRGEAAHDPEHRTP